MSELRTNRIVPRDGLPSGSSGGVIQVKSATKTDGDFNTSSSSYTDVTGLSVSITPTRSDSKILIFATVHGVGDARGGRVQATMGSMYEDQENDTNCCSQTFLDSPSTTSAVTYKIQARTQGAGTIYINRSRGDQNSANSGTFTSSITVMEVSG